MPQKKSVFYDEIDVGKVRGSDEGLDGSVGGDAAKMMQQKRSQTLRWLKIVFLGTLLLLVFELLLGWAAEAVTMLADAAHTGCDVISYGINWLVEWWKSTPGPGKKREVSIQNAAATARVIDTAGCFVGMLTLVLATCWAASKAWHELHVTKEGKAHIGSALLLFSITSAAVNIGMLQMRPRRQSPKDKTGSRATPTSIDQSTPGSKLAVGDLVFCQPCSPPAKQRKLPPAADELDTQSPAADDLDDGGLSSLHMIIHPGCACSSSSPWCPEDSALEQELQSELAIPKDRSLNLTAAKLHLFSDMMRSILILLVALLIQLGIVEDARRADAICGLIVAFFIVIGSVALVLRLAGRLGSFFRKKSSGSTVTEESGGSHEKQQAPEKCPEPQKAVQPDV